MEARNTGAIGQDSHTIRMTKCIERNNAHYRIARRELLSSFFTSKQRIKRVHATALTIRKRVRILIHVHAIELSAHRGHFQLTECRSVVGVVRTTPSVAIVAAGSGGGVGGATVGHTGGGAVVRPDLAERTRIAKDRGEDGEAFGPGHQSNIRASSAIRGAQGEARQAAARHRPAVPKPENARESGWRTTHQLDADRKLNQTRAPSQPHPRPLARRP